MPQLPITITEIPLGKDVLRIEFVELHGHANFSARKFFKKDDGQWQASKHGLAFYIERLPDVVAAFENALNQARAEKLLP